MTPVRVAAGAVPEKNRKKANRSAGHQEAALRKEGL